MSDDPIKVQPTTDSLLGNLYHAEGLRNAMLLLVAWNEHSRIKGGEKCGDEKHVATGVKCIFMTSASSPLSEASLISAQRAGIF
jgi:hypothetical protein